MQATEKPANRKARKRKNANRDQEIVTGFDRYHKVAYSVARRYYANWFPSEEDLFQATALAAAEALAQFGEQTELGPLCQLIDLYCFLVASPGGILKQSVTGVKTSTKLRSGSSLPAASTWHLPHSLFQLNALLFLYFSSKLVYYL